MPVYRTGRKVSRERRITALKGNKMRFFKRKLLWGVQSTPLDSVEFELGFQLKNHVENLSRKSSPIVVDFGCGEGDAAAEIAMDVPKSRVYGFSDNSYRNWNRIINGDKKKDAKPVQNVKFIHAEAKDFFRYFKDNSIDLLYSRLGLVHVPEQVEYLKQLIPKLRKGGSIVTEESSHVKTFWPLIGDQKPRIETRNKPPHEYQVEVYRLPNYSVEFRPNSIILIKRIK